MWKIKKYFNEVEELFNIEKIIIFGLAFAFILSFLYATDIPNMCLSLCPSELMPMLIICVFVISICSIRLFHFVDFISTPCVNMLDIIALTSVLGIAVFIVSVYLVYGQFGTVQCVCIFLLLFLCIVIYLRIKRCASEPNKNNYNNIFDFYDVFSGNFKPQEGHPILIAENEVDYDLLDRSGIINQLVSSLFSVKSDKSYVIGLEGDWGSGKTTIVKNAKRILRQSGYENIEIKDFDPWIFGSEEALLWSMYDTILESNGVRYKIYQGRNTLRSLVMTAVDISNAGGLFTNGFFSKVDTYDEIKRIKNRLSMLLKSTDKTYVFFIDNVDRASSDNIIFLFKLIGDLFDLPQVIYVLLYDRTRLENIFKDTTQVEPKYLEKIIQQEIKVPAIREDRLKQIYATSITNLLKAYGIDQDGVSEYDDLFILICDKVKDLRKFKRLVNSAFVTAFSENEFLNKNELLIIETIRFLQPDLYLKISENKKFLVSTDRRIDRNLWVSDQDRPVFEKNAKEFLEDLSNYYSDYEHVLSDIFPILQRFIEGQELFQNSDGININHDGTSLTPDICSAKFFDLYFSYGNNFYISLKQEIKQFIDKIVTANSEKDIIDIFHGRFEPLSENGQREWLTEFESHLGEIPHQKLCDTAVGLISEGKNIHSTPGFLDDINIAEDIVVKLIIKAPLNDVKRFTVKVSSFYEELTFIENIYYSLKNTKSNVSEEYAREKAEEIDNLYNSMCTKVLETPIDLYSDEYYNHNNIFGLSGWCKRTNGYEAAFRSYMEGLLSEENIYRVLGDTITEYPGSKYNYCVIEQEFKELCLDEGKIDIILERRLPKSEEETFILEIYNKYRGREESNSEYCIVELPTELDFKKL